MLPTANAITTPREVRYAWWLASMLATMSASALFTSSLVSRSRRSAKGAACLSCISRPSATRSRRISSITRVTTAMNCS